MRIKLFLCSCTLTLDNIFFRFGFALLFTFSSHSVANSNANSDYIIISTHSGTNSLCVDIDNGSDIGSYPLSLPLSLLLFDFNGMVHAQVVRKVMGKNVSCTKIFIFVFRIFMHFSMPFFRVWQSQRMERATANLIRWSWNAMFECLLLQFVSSNIRQLFVYSKSLNSNFKFHLVMCKCKTNIMLSSCMCVCVNSSSLWFYNRFLLSFRNNHCMHRIRWHEKCQTKILI